MIKYLASIFILFTIQQCNDKPILEPKFDNTITPTRFAELPKKLDESSGLEVIKDKLYSINDSGGKSEIFVLNKEGEEIKRIKVKNAKNYDWESLATNDTHFYIGDFGNNSGNRDNLVIYFFPIDKLDQNKVEAEVIKFRYKNQTDYFQENRNHSFDGEALIALNDQLIIFSKDWRHQYTQVYHIPLEDYEKEMQISPTEKFEINALITGADYDAENRRLVLCGYKNHHNYIWIFESSSPKKFLTDTMKKYNLDGLYKAQVEGVAFLSPEKLIISTEETKKFDQQLWVIDIP